MPPLQTPGTAYTNPKTFPQGSRPRAAYMRPLRTYRERQANPRAGKAVFYRAANLIF